MNNPTTTAMQTPQKSPNDQAHPSPHRHRVGGWSRWFALLGAPLAWLTQIFVNAGLAGHACFPDDAPLKAPLWAHLPLTTAAVEALVLLMCLAAGLTGWRNWRRSRHERKGDAHQLVSGGDGRTRFMAMAGMLVSGLFAVAAVFGLLGALTVPPCGG